MLPWNLISKSDLYQFCLCSEIFEEKKTVFTSKLSINEASLEEHRMLHLSIVPQIDAATTKKKWQYHKLEMKLIYCTSITFEHRMLILSKISRVRGVK
jgi:hypothetical protein